MYTTCQLIWHKNENNLPKKDGEYLCKCTTMLFSTGCTEPYYNVVAFQYGGWCGGKRTVIIAWAEIPNCDYEIR